MSKFPFKSCRSALLFSGDVSNEPDPNFLQTAGCDVDGAILAWTKKEKVILTSKMNATKAESSFKGRVVSIDSIDLSKTLKAMLPNGRIGLDLSHITAARYLRLGKLMGRNRLVDISDDLDNLRRVKRKDEIAKIKKAVQISKSILSSLRLSPSMTELDVVRQLGLKCAERNVIFAYPPIVAAGKNSREPHHDPGPSHLGQGVVLIDFGVKYQHYCADLSRCYFLGPAKEERQKYEEAKKIHAAVVSAIPTFKTGGELGRFADEYSRKKLHWPRMLHSVGHGLGLEVHDPPHLGLKSKDRLQPGVVLAIEPGWYGKDYGVRYEDDLVIGKKKAQIL